MSLTASISTTTNSSISNMSFSLFPELLKEDDDNNDMSTSFFNDGNDDDDGGDGGGGALTDINITNNENNGMIMATAAAAVPATRMSSIYPTDYDVNNTDGPDRINTDGIIEVLRPKSKDIIMGKGQWNKFHPGNIAFKLSLNNEREQYELANRFERMRVVDRMLNELLGIKKHLGGKTSTPSTPLSPSSSSSSVAAAATANNVVGGGGNGARFLYKEKKKKITATSSDNASKDTAQEARTNHSEDNNHRNDNNQNDDNDKQQQYEQQQLSLLFDAGPWLIATREKAHDKITHDFRNMRRQTQLQQQQQQHFL
ncbi:hypothetical protein FRACYDRAFT_271929 [Fragilariopsis cylindrus CCMP1102]|uniref:Uncharacterized protein n=1 Tax=Fragilariopsis cylindrus CCMP1102 TaxID=635003 RepID=A0A1E7EP89_9STRA|nr:hypothetical protein FRACYDRAFT_271929 [Fragilariopsis cylindrus CCMP1102]|eukprot:OEU07792.1 hypothetical protein FRACYDRAFT_271929 [Fragilariopsis cylindrus CCMP1102]